MTTQKRPKNGFKDQLSLNAGQKYYRSKVLQNAPRPSFSYHLPLKPLFCLFLSGRFRQVLLYVQTENSVLFIIRLDGFNFRKLCGWELFINKLILAGNKQHKQFPRWEGGGGKELMLILGCIRTVKHYKNLS